MKMKMKMKMKIYNYKITLNDFKIIKGEEPDFKDPKGKDLLSFSSKYLKSILNKGNFNKEKYTLTANHEKKY